MNENSITVCKYNDPTYERMFDYLIQEVFGFSFAQWFERKLWDERYESYSIIQDGIMLSNVCIFKTDMIVSGRKIQAHQFGAIATKEDVRKRGLSRYLIEHVLSLYPETPAFLSANPSVIDFYQRFGFRHVQTYRPRIAAVINNASDKAIKHSSDDSFIHQALYGKRIYSETVDCLNTQSVQIFNLLMTFKNGIYYLPDCGAIVVAMQDGINLFLADVITQNVVSFEEIKAELPFSGVEFVEFGFCPERLGIHPHWEKVEMNDEPFFLKGEWGLPEKFCIPSLSTT